MIPLSVIDALIKKLEDAERIDDYNYYSWDDVQDVILTLKEYKEKKEAIVPEGKENKPLSTVELFRQLKENIEFIKVVTTANNTDDLGIDEYKKLEDIATKLLKQSRNKPLEQPIKELIDNAMITTLIPSQPLPPEQIGDFVRDWFIDELRKLLSSSTVEDKKE